MYPCKAPEAFYDAECLTFFSKRELQKQKEIIKKNSWTNFRRRNL